MKLIDLLEKEDKKGTYVGAKFTNATVARLKKFSEKNNIPNYLSSDKYHTTIIYSKKYVPDLKIESKLEKQWKGKPEKLEIFKTQQGWKALVLIYECKQQTDKHESIMDSTDATYDYPEYKVHVTLSYNIEDYDEEKLKDLSLESIGEIVIDRLYQEDLNLNWAEKTVKDKD